VRSPAQRAARHTGTGYFPINSKALDEPADKAWAAQYPQFTTAISNFGGYPLVVWVLCWCGSEEPPTRVDNPSNERRLRRSI
jgi:hypothetical protein